MCNFVDDVIEKFQCLKYVYFYKHQSTRHPTTDGLTHKILKLSIFFKNNMKIPSLALNLTLLTYSTWAFHTPSTFTSITANKFGSSSALQVLKEEDKLAEKETNSDGLPWWWELVWDLDIMKRGEPGTDIIFGDSAHVLRTNIEQIYGDYPSLDGCPLGEGAIDDIADGTMFIGLQRYYNENGSPYKLCFGPKSFLVVSDPVQAKHILRDANRCVTYVVIVVCN